MVCIMVPFAHKHPPEKRCLWLFHKHSPEEWSLQWFALPINIPFAHKHSSEEWCLWLSCFPQTLPRGLFPNGFLCPPTLLGRMVCPLWPLSTIIADDSQLTTGYILLWVLVAHHPLTTHCPLLITNYLPATSYKTCHYQLPTKNFLLSTAPFSLLTTDYFLLTSSRATTEY